MVKTILKIIITVMLLLCLTDMPYGYYNLVRFTATASFVYLSYSSFKSSEEGKGFFYGSLVLLFQPFFKIALGRTLWNVVDVLVAIVLIYFIIIELRNKNSQSNLNSFS